MASTRNRNSQGDYRLEMNAYDKFCMNKTDEAFATPQETMFSGNGLLPGNVNGSKLSRNYCDIESQLFGIGATNLVEPLPEFTPEINQLRSLNVAERIPTIVPEPFTHDTRQRPFRGIQ
jgi:hypothetical protein